MRRALILILILSGISFCGGMWLDHLQQQTAETYLEKLMLIQACIRQNQADAALQQLSHFHSTWQHDAHWLNYVLDHHHTRDVESSMRQLATALQEHNRTESLLAADELTDALEEIAQRDLPLWENIM